jgi:glycosyltransferase involved in cell wall biosynthesis
MKILIVSDTYYPHVNGAAYFTHRLAHYLQEKGHEIAVIAASTKLTSEYSKRDGINTYGAPSIPVGVYHNFRNPLPIFSNMTARKALREFKPDIVHVQMHFLISRAVLKAAKKLGVPAMATNHFMPENLVHYLPFPAFIRNWIASIMWWDCTRVLRNALLITAPTVTAANMMHEHLHAIPVSNGIDLARFNPHNNGEYLRERYNIPNKPTFLFVGRLDKEKKVDDVLRAFKLVLEKVDGHLIIAGSGMEKKILEHLADELGISGHVTFAGFVPDIDLPNLYCITDAFIIAGIAELQSIVTMEAMASGLPVVGVNAVALPELIHDGENGFLFENGDIKSLAEKMTKILSDESLRKQMGVKSLEIIAKHDIHKIIDEFEALYQKLINQNKK